MTSKVALLLALTAGLGYGLTSASPSQSKQALVKAGEIGSRLPEFTVKDLRGRSISSADLRGKVVLIDFWATWCKPCEKEMPGYQTLLDEYGSHGFVVIGFKSSMMQDTEDPLKFAERIGVQYPMVVATGDLVRKFGGIEGLPTTMLYDRREILRDKVIGFEYTNTIETKMRKLLVLDSRAVPTFNVLRGHIWTAHLDKWNGKRQRRAIDTFAPRGAPTPRL